MACGELVSGTAFLARTLAQIDCQATNIGSYGYGALADPSSPVAAMLGGLLTLMVAIFGLRMLLGFPVHVRDGVGLAVRIGIVLTLATSWPAWRVVGYDVIMDGPSQIVGSIATSVGLPNGNTLRQRLQNVDDGLVAITGFGTGRLPGSDAREQFRGIAMSDETGFGWGRLFFLVFAVAPYAAVRLGAGILLALTPLFSLFLLFGGSTGLFFGWLRGLAFAALGSLSLTLIQGVGLALFEPWIANIAARRIAGQFAPAAATEMAALSLVMLMISFGILLLLAKTSYFPWFLSSPSPMPVYGPNEAISNRSEGEVSAERVMSGSADRARDIASAVARTVRREELQLQPSNVNMDRGTIRSHEAEGDLPSARLKTSDETLGSTYRRSFRRTISAIQKRDSRT